MVLGRKNRLPPEASENALQKKPESGNLPRTAIETDAIQVCRGGDFTRELVYACEMRKDLVGA